MFFGVFFVASQQGDIRFFKFGEFGFDVIGHRCVPVMLFKRQAQVFTFESIAVPGADKITDNTNKRLREIFDIFAG